MNIKEKVKNYYSKKSKFSIFSDIIFAAFIIALIIPQSRVEVIALINKARVLVLQPSVEDNDEIISLTDNDYNWSAKNINGETVELSELKGKVIFVNLWATWCPPCIAEMPSIEKLYNIYKDNDKIAFLIVSNEDEEKVKAFMEKRGFKFPVYVSNFKLPQVLSTESIPTTFLVSKSGKIVVKQVGATNWHGDKMQSIVNKLIAE
ncbi:MAG: TlpA family protein disulfide reductase [Bacteroidales bacterium]|nr:TlpA family protein disulfide reductase [Bacteroidales bacterium]MBN2758023.1 TlpA family protein disulfide reductase [Bacteroidales bacterium]